MIRAVASCVAALVLVASCGGPPATPSAQPSAVRSVAVPASVAAVSTPVPTPTPRAAFPAGLYLVRPALDHPGGTLELLESAAKLARQLDFAGVGYDISADLFVSTTFDGLVLARPDGSSQTVKVPGLYALGRPSLSPDSKQVFVQATETAFTPSPTVQRPLDDTVYIVDVASGAFRRIGDKPAPNDASTQSEQPVWSPRGDFVAHWAAEAGCLVIKVRDAATAKDLLTIRRNGTTGCYQPQRGILDGPRFHISISHDSSRILSVGQMQLYDSKTGALVGDIHAKVLDAVASAGYKPDTRFPGAAGAGTLPLSAAFSPDDKQIAFDGAVEKDGQYGLALFRINVDGTGFSVLRPPVPSTPQFSNGHNFSQLLPHWR